MKLNKYSRYILIVFLFYLASTVFLFVINRRDWAIGALILAIFPLGDIALTSYRWWRAKSRK